jgi:D-lactate dehydrogenase
MALLTPDARRIAPQPPAGGPAPDRAPDWVAAGTPVGMRNELVSLLGSDRVLGRALDLVRYASDASPYRLIPQAVVMAHDLDDIVKLLGWARQAKRPLVFRAGGTSLNGQSQSDSMLVDVRRHWQRIRVLESGLQVRVQPGAVLGHVNRMLARHGRKLGPDPASTDIACVGGVIANNSGGMRCGVVADSYRTVRSMTLVLANGLVIDTAAPDAEERFAAAAPELASGLLAIRDQIRDDSELSARIARKFAIKNTTGYRLCAFLDADEPLEIFRRIVIGSEGTLAFVAEAVFDTVALGRHASTGLILFEDIDAAAAAVPPLVELGSTATELMVAPTLIAAAWSMPGTPERWKELPPAAAAVLVEFRHASQEALAELEQAALNVLAGRPTLDPPSLTRDAEQTEMLWRVREGMFGLLAAVRAPGVSLITEDICVPPDRVAEAARDLQELLGRHGFLQGLAGHASAGNLHFLLTPNFGEPADLQRYDAFMRDLVDLIVDRYDGSLKAEHGTGLNMAPFVEREWGPEATALMWRVKELADPDGILGPGVVLNHDSGVHLRNLKQVPEIEAVATKCVECGFCEPVCPSRNVTTTPRQRIVLRREMARQPAGSPVLNALLEQYEYDGIETCAADGSCSAACPVGIDTGKLIKEFRRIEHAERAEAAALRMAQRYALVERTARAAVAGARLAARVLGDDRLAAMARVVRGSVSSELVPVWPSRIPQPAPARLPATSRDGAAAVYLPACVNRIFGNPAGIAAHPTLPEAMVAVSARAGLPVWIPPGVSGRCCATPWSSKGYSRGHAWMATATAEALLEWSSGGLLPIVVDASSCTHGLLSEVPGTLPDGLRERFSSLQILDSVQWAHEHLLPGLTVGRRVRSVLVHPTCSAGHLGLTWTLQALAAALADEVVVPAGSGCCGMAGDRGWLHPSLTRSALRDLFDELDGRSFDRCVSSNRTCEAALHEVTGRPYHSIVLLLEEMTR